MTTLIVTGCSLATPGPAAADDDPPTYDIRFTVTPVPDRHGAEVEATVKQDDHALRQLSMRMPSSRFSDISGDGDLGEDDGWTEWEPPEDGGTLRWFVNLRHRRTSGTYDAYMNDDWALFRSSDIIPPARTRTSKSAISRTALHFDLPDGWSSSTEYDGKNHRYVVDNPRRRYDRPTGWILLGDIGTRVEDIVGVHVKVGGPTGQSVRRMDLLALMNWTLPQLARVLPDMPARLTIVSADANMWRGGLSAPQSLFIHASLPLISENGTSTVLHEVLHVMTGLIAEDGSDWIIEGLAEYYSVELMRRSRTITNQRFSDSIAGLREWGSEADALCDGASTGDVTARAVAVLVDLDAELRGNSGNRKSLDDVVRALVAADERVTLDAMRDIVEKIHGKPAKSLAARRLPGCD